LLEQNPASRATTSHARGPDGAEDGRGTEREFGPGDAFHMPPGHGACIVVMNRVYCSTSVA
jgi:hypothetical protein